MSITPTEMRNVVLQRVWLRGYRRGGVDQLLEEIADSLGEVSRERDRLSARLEELEDEVAKHRELETLLRATLVSAERAAQDQKEQARRESDLIVQEAHADARRITRESAAERRRLEEDVTTIRAQLKAAFEMLGEWPPGSASTKSEEATSASGPTAIREALDSGVRSLTRSGATEIGS
jgi:cell division initiation protein